MMRKRKRKGEESERDREKEERKAQESARFVDFEFCRAVFTRPVDDPSLTG